MLALGHNDDSKMGEDTSIPLLTDDGVVFFQRPVLWPAAWFIHSVANLSGRTEVGIAPCDDIVGNTP